MAVGVATDGVRADGQGIALLGKAVTTTLAKPTYGGGTPPNQADDADEEVEPVRSVVGAAGARTNEEAAVGNEPTWTMLTCV